MINKQGLWFVTLFSLILVLSIYYVTMSDDTLSRILDNNNDINENTTPANVNIEESSILAALRVDDEEEMLKAMNELQTILLDDTATLQEKNDAYDELIALNANKGKEEELEKKIKDEFQLNSFVKVQNDQISVVVESKDHSVETANNIIRSIQSLYSKKMYITVKFQK
ncbi:MAG: SpoIIIAH-like family protein [Bacilli bacterium]|jgi:stage III sporulation protein AH|nr:SpoIIIAH-like family protein [Bacilli bacterium]